MTVEETMQYIQNFSKSGAPVKDLSRCGSLLEELGNPQDGLRVVHIAGTNGKGSTLELASTALIASGYRVGQFTSPYMRRYNDRIRINGMEIPDETLAELCTQVAACRVSALCSQFEITFAIALLYFAAEACDVVFLETGIGGLLDATNLVKQPLVSVITSISLDHVGVLGNTIPEIAAQKLGILKHDCPAVISADNTPEVLAMAAEAAAAQEAPLVVPKFSDCKILEQDLLHTKFQYRGHTVTLYMPGLHQVQNAITAMEVLHLLEQQGMQLPEKRLERAFASVSVPARIQVLCKEPLVLLDGSHNESGVGALAELLETCGGGVPVIGVCGMLLTKDYQTATKILGERLCHVICTDDFTHGTVPKEQLAECFAPYCETELAASPQEALQRAIVLALKKEALVIISGSLYLASCFLQDPELPEEENTLL